MAISTDVAESDVGVFEPGRPIIDPVKMLRIHGYRDFGMIRPVIRETADRIAERAAGVMSPVVHYRRAAIEACDGNDLRLAKGVRFQNPVFPKYFAAAEEIVAVVITVGKGLDDEVMERMEVFEPLEALFLETAGWLGVEWTTKRFVEFLQETVGPEGYRVSRRLGPGYSYKVDGDEIMWSLEEQRELFRVFDGYELPVRLLESCAMMPKMSRSGLYGLTADR